MWIKRVEVNADGYVVRYFLLDKVRLNDYN